MKKVYLLDCTLRDGGFVNQWRFGEDCIINIFERLQLAGMDLIEVGYLRDYVAFDMNETQFPDTASVNKVIPPALKKDAKVVAIIDFGDCSIDKISPCSQTILDGIRVTFKRRQLEEAVEFCRKIIAKGYFVSLQPVSFMDYTPDDVLKLVHAANELKPLAVCIVDTYGFMNKHDLLRYYSLMDATLAPDIILGYHSHNNFQLAYANAIELVEQFTQRDMIVDTSIMGMGKGAGNAATELMAMYLNSNMGKNYDISQILEIADTYIEKEMKENPWGYSLKYYLAASNYCHHKYVSFLLNKKTLSIKSINDILSRIDQNKKTSYDESHIAQLYREYQAEYVDDDADVIRMHEKIHGRPVLVLAPGSSLKAEKDKITAFIDAEKPYIICINHISERYFPDAVFISNHKRYSQVALRLRKYPSKTMIIATSNINPTTLKSDVRLNYSSLLLADRRIADNATLMLLNALIRMGLTKVWIAGFDGYIKDADNYFDKSWDFMGEPWKNNQAVKEAVSQMGNKLQIHFITSSQYV